MVDKLNSQGYTYSVSAVSKWVKGKRTLPAEIVDFLEDLFEVKRGWLLKCAGYPADAQVRSSLIISSEQANHFKELSVTLLALASNLESYQVYADDDSTSRSGNIIDRGWLNLVHGEPDALSVELVKIDKHMALDILQHLKHEFAELADINDWIQLAVDKITDDFIARLKLKAYQGDFTGKCDHCPSDD